MGSASEVLRVALNNPSALSCWLFAVLREWQPVPPPQIRYRPVDCLASSRYQELQEWPTIFLYNQWGDRKDTTVNIEMGKGVTRRLTASSTLKKKKKKWRKKINKQFVNVCRSWASADVTIADKWASTSFLYLTLMCFRANVAVERGWHIYTYK